MNLSKKIILTVLAFVGFLTSIKLSMIYIDANFNPYALSSFCSINDLIDCDGVAKTTHSQFFGIPLAFWGLFLYFVFLFFVYVQNIKNITIGNFRPFAFCEVFKNSESYISALGLIAFSISMILAFISIFEIQKICVLCFFTYFLNLLIALIAKPQDENLLQIFVTSFNDFLDALKKYAIPFVVCVFFTACILTYTTISNVFTPQVKLQKDLKAYSTPSGDDYKVSGNMLGDKDATLIVHEYTDYQCPYCFVLNTMTMRAVSELANVKIIHHNLPLDTACNSTMKYQMHPGSCTMAKYAIAAGYQGKYWDLNNMLFDQKDGEYMDEEKLLRDAKKLGLNIKKLKEDAYSEKVAQEIQREIKESSEFGIDGTPAFRINLETHVGILPYDEFKERLIKAGATERK